MTDRINPEVPLRLRPAVFADAEAINKVHLRNGMGTFDTASWRFCWESYPFAQEFANVPIGWVMEPSDGTVVGTIGNVHIMYEMNGRRFKTAIAAAWAVDPPSRGKSLSLATTVEPAGLQLGQPVAPPGAAEENWRLVADEQQRLVKTDGRLIKHARYYWLVLAESHLTRRLFGQMLRRIWALPMPSG
jgi:hypothetical protein